jgi:hypothetical protein
MATGAQPIKLFPGTFLCLLPPLFVLFSPAAITGIERGLTLSRSAATMALAFASRSLGSRMEDRTMTTADRQDGLDVAALVHRVADQFQQKRRMVVDPSARDALIAPALPHADNVAQALARKEITVQFLEECVTKLLERARRFASAAGVRHVNGPAVEQAMEKDCPYLFWC